MTSKNNVPVGDEGSRQELCTAVWSYCRYYLSAVSMKQIAHRLQEWDCGMMIPRYASSEDVLEDSRSSTRSTTII